MEDIKPHLLHYCEARVDGLNVVQERSENNQIFCFYIWPNPRKITCWKFRLIFSETTDLNIYYKTPGQTTEESWHHFTTDLEDLIYSDPVFLSSTRANKPRIALKILFSAIESASGWLEHKPPIKGNDVQQDIKHSEIKQAESLSEAAIQANHKKILILTLTYAARYLGYSTVGDLGDRCRLGGIREAQVHSANELKEDLIQRLQPFLSKNTFKQLGINMVSYEIEYNKIQDLETVIKRIYECLCFNCPHQMDMIDNDLTKIYSKLNFQVDLENF